MGIRERFLGIAIGLISSLIIVMCLILFWGPLGTLVAGMNVGILMFLNSNFWTFLLFFMGLSFIVSLVVGFAVKAKWGSKN